MFQQDQAHHTRRNSQGCFLSSKVVSCGGHGVLSLNDVNVGVAYFHTVYDVLAGLAFLLDFLRKHATDGVKLVENVCIDAKGCGWAPFEKKCVSGTPDFPCGTFTVVQWEPPAHCYQVSYNEKRAFASFTLTEPAKTM